MLFRPSPRALLGLVAVPVLLLATACSGSVSVGSDPTVTAGDVESQVSKAMTDQGRTGVQVTCPNELEGTKGASTTCNATDDAGATQATVTVTSVDGTDVKFDISSVPVLAAADVAQKASEQLAAQVGAAAPDITCPGDLVGTIGATLVCTLNDAGQTYDTTLTVTDDGEGSIRFDIDVASTPSS